MPSFPKRSYRLQSQAVESEANEEKKGTSENCLLPDQNTPFSPSKLFKGIKDHCGKFIFHCLCVIPLGITPYGVLPQKYCWIWGFKPNFALGIQDLSMNLFGC